MKVGRPLAGPPPLPNMFSIFCELCYRKPIEKIVDHILPATVWFGRFNENPLAKRHLSPAPNGSVKVERPLAGPPDFWPKSRPEFLGTENTVYSSTGTWDGEIQFLQHVADPNTRDY